MIGVVNIDDKYGRRLAASALGAGHDVLGAPAQAEADWRAVDVRSGADGSTFRVIGPGGVEADVSVGLAGAFNVANALGAVVALVEAGVRLEDAVAGIAACPGVPGRLQRVPAPGLDVTAFVDYSHKPGAVEAVLRSLRPVTQRQPDHRARLRRRPGPGQAADDGRGRRVAGRCGHSHQRQPAIRGSAGHPGRDAGRRAERAAGRRARVIVEPDRAAAIWQARQHGRARAT